MQHLGSVAPQGPSSEDLAAAALTFGAAILLIGLALTVAAAFVRRARRRRHANYLIGAGSSDRW